jgi:hypothetical protein
VRLELTRVFQRFPSSAGYGIIVSRTDKWFMGRRRTRLADSAFKAAQVIGIAGLLYWMLWNLGRIAVPVFWPVLHRTMLDLIVAPLAPDPFVALPDLVLRSITFLALVCGVYGLLHIVLISPRLIGDVALSWEEAESAFSSLVCKLRGKP